MKSCCFEEQLANNLRIPKRMHSRSKSLCYAFLENSAAFEYEKRGNYKFFKINLNTPEFKNVLNSFEAIDINAAISSIASTFGV